MMYEARDNLSEAYGYVGSVMFEAVGATQTWRATIWSLHFSLLMDRLQAVGPGLPILRSAEFADDGLPWGVNDLSLVLQQWDSISLDGVDEDLQRSHAVVLWLLKIAFEKSGPPDPVCVRVQCN
jgi:hypothetical protein